MRGARRAGGITSFLSIAAVVLALSACDGLPSRGEKIDAEIHGNAATRTAASTTGLAEVVVPHIRAAPLWKLVAVIEYGGDSLALDDVDRGHLSTAGDLVVSQPRFGEFLILSAKGAAVRRIGRRGEGPGDFATIGEFGFLGDTLWATDFRNRRMTLMSLDGTVLGMIPYAHNPTALLGALLPTEVAGPTREFLVTEPWTVAPGGQAIAIPSSPERAFTPYRSHTPVILLRRDLTPVRVLALLPTSQATYVVADGDQTRVVAVNPPFGMEHLAVATASGGDRVLLVSASYADSIVRLLQLSPSGDTISDARIAFSPRRMNSATIDRIAGQVATQSGRPVDSALVREALATVPPFVAPFVGAQIATDGTIWLNRHSGTDMLWFAVSKTGIPIGRVALRFNQQPLAFEKDHVWIASRDTNDVSTVARYRIDKFLSQNDRNKF